MTDAIEIYVRDVHSGWLLKLNSLSQFNFNRLNPDMTGFPIYHDADGNVWPKAAEGVVIYRNGLSEARVDITRYFDMNQT